MIRMCHYVTHCALFIIVLLVPPTKCMAEPVAVSDLERIAQQILLTRNQLIQVSAELRDAKVLAAEKMRDYEISRDAFQREQTAVTTNSFDHAQQRLALAEMGVESKTARFARIQRKLEELALAKQDILTGDTGENQPEKFAADSQLSSPQPRPKPRPTPTNTGATTRKLAPPPAVKKMLQHNLPHEPVLTQQGKVSDIYQLNAELQKLEHHLITRDTNAAESIQAKAYGTAIAGEIALIEMGGNQFFARFSAPAGTVSVIVGARHGPDYVRTELQMTFSAEEAGKDFVLIFDINTKEQPRALVFQESLAFTQEIFASHSNF
jgi:hypothetical protein